MRHASPKEFLNLIFIGFLNDSPLFSAAGCGQVVRERVIIGVWQKSVRR